MFTIDTRPSAATSALVAKSLTRLLTPERLLTALVHTRMWAVIALPEGITPRPAPGSTSLFAEPLNPRNLTRRVADAKQVATDAGHDSPDPVYASTLPLTRIRWDYSWVVDSETAPSMRYQLTVYLQPHYLLTGQHPSHDDIMRMDGVLEQSPLVDFGIIPESALAPKYRIGSIEFDARPGA